MEGEAEPVRGSAQARPEGRGQLKQRGGKKMRFYLLRLAVRSPRRYRRALHLYRALLPKGRSGGRGQGQ